MYDSDVPLPFLEVKNACAQYAIGRVISEILYFLNRTGHTSLGNLPSLSYGSVYMKLWHGLCNLDNDPHPAVGAMSHKVTNHIRNKVTSDMPFKSQLM